MKLPKLPSNSRKLVTRDCPSPPDCPHCGADMDDAPLTLGALSGALADGCVLDDRSGVFNGHLLEPGLRCACPSCGRESVLAVDVRAVDRLYLRLAPFWTKTDDRYLSALFSGPTAEPSTQPAKE